MEVKLIILVMCSSSNKYKKLEKAIKQTWALNAHPDVLIIFYSDNGRKVFKKNKPIFNGKDLILPCKDGYYHCLEKTIQAFDFINKNFTYKYIFRTNLGSYISLEKIVAFLNNKSEKEFYCGIIGNYLLCNKIIPFASGSGFFLSKDLVELLVTNRNNLDYSLIDDVAFGVFMNDKKILINNNALRLSYTNNLIEYHIGSQTVDCINNNLLYHIRLRSSDRNIDIKRMYALSKSDF
ncbi:glycosyltransferase family protein [Mucilaginibacter segetis]|uniref:Glycosyltransferase n=1 Tax=Mucilaginibacter segetis TaxID=2793071 RepID=A0A934UL67_9SPHI|nr:hypothetical protein [Mucilaginibacter segetis]MBK0378203.1 hypothetical protein [Mucilaginibacter segetis]